MTTDMILKEHGPILLYSAIDGQERSEKLCEDNVVNPISVDITKH